MPNRITMQRLTDLREILRYVPRYRDKLFVIALDGRIVDHANFRNLLLDVAVLGSLRIGVVLVHGAGHQIEQMAAQLGKTPSNIDGTGVTDEATLELALNAANRVTHEILEGLTVMDLRGAYGNAVVAHPAGILGGVDHQHTGRVERVDAGLLRNLMSHHFIPVVPPLGIDGEGRTYRLNSDAVAVEVAAALQAVKLIYLTSAEGVKVKGDGSAPELVRQMSIEAAEALLKERSAEVQPPVLSKLRHAVRAAGKGVPRVHIIDGRVEEGLLAEVFSNDGIGTLIYTNEYQAIRPARRTDARAVFALLEIGMKSDELMQRSLDQINATIKDFVIFEVDGAPAGCAALHLYPSENKAEMACVCVHPKYENQGIGALLVSYLEAQAREKGAAELFCLSTQAYNYFQQKGGFAVCAPDDLPESRRDVYNKSGRRSVVLRKGL